MSKVVTRGWYGVPVRDNGDLNIDYAWFNGQRTAGVGSFNYSKVDFTFSEFTAAGLTEQILAFNLQPKEHFVKAFYNVDTVFDDDPTAAMTALTLSLGITGNETKYMPFPVSGQATGLKTPHVDIEAIPEHMTNETAIYIYAQATGANLDTLTRGVAQLYIATAILP